jgi:hypothetical protein
MATQLKDAGLKWVPELLDFFSLPDRHLDEKIFVISDLLATVEQLQGIQVVSFQGASEWALDYLVTADAVWIPREDQLRQALEAVLLTLGNPEVRLSCGLEGCTCTAQAGEIHQSFRGKDASEAYASAVLWVLRQTQSPGNQGPGEITQSS